MSGSAAHHRQGRRQEAEAILKQARKLLVYMGRGGSGSGPWGEAQSPAGVDIGIVYEGTQG